ncbi:cysteine hydrolase family protein [Blastococcus saxobsidens]|uniref:Nicotinamidase-related amidase n=1 Tax=Blastococcus saxobsidens TaxID=138336 RepID=A0A4Q7Y5A6_9ACTN|nr:isochorismatase family cysteine hydrolase [Blastococcus saxobsidens]RZU31808.1 nicotinamidase-related amidase [Blastococcus saxobsidens]
MGAGWPTDVDPHLAPEPERSALLVIDTQVDFLDGGSSPIAGTSAVVPTIARLVRGFRAAGRPVVHVIRLYDGDDVDLPRRSLIASGAPVVRPGSAGSQLAPDLRPAPDVRLSPRDLLAGELQPLGPREWAMWKPRWGAFHRTPLDAHLRALGVGTVVVAGCNYANCPRATLYGASEHDYRTVIAADAISGLDARHLEEAARIGVLHATTTDILARLSRG